jgi:hypothetical protein
MTIHKAVYDDGQEMSLAEFQAKLLEIEQSPPSSPRRPDPSQIYRYNGIVFARPDDIPSIKMGICVLCPEGQDLPDWPIPKIPPEAARGLREKGFVTFESFVPEDESSFFGPQLAEPVMEALEAMGYRMDDELFPDLGWKYNRCITGRGYAEWNAHIELPDPEVDIPNHHVYWIQFTDPSQITTPPRQITLSHARQLSIEKAVAIAANAFFADFNKRGMKVRPARDLLS